MYPQIKLSRGDTKIRTQFNGGFLWHIFLTFDIDDETEFESCIIMAEYGGDNAAHYHTAVNHNPPNGHYRFSHEYLIHALDAYSSKNDDADDKLVTA